MPLNIEEGVLMRGLDIMEHQLAVADAAPR